MTDVLGPYSFVTLAMASFCYDETKRESVVKQASQG
jgi:hypothetical protein